MRGDQVKEGFATSPGYRFQTNPAQAVLLHGPYDPADPVALDVSMVNRDPVWSPRQTPKG